MQIKLAASTLTVNWVRTTNTEDTYVFYLVKEEIPDTTGFRVNSACGVKYFMDPIPAADISTTISGSQYTAKIKNIPRGCVDETK